MTHWEGCWNQGPEHYECAVAHIRALEAELAEARRERDDAQALVEPQGLTIQTLQDELAEARLDAERWRKLQTMKASVVIAGIRENAMARRGAAPPFGLTERVDAAIDAARKETP